MRHILYSLLLLVLVFPAAWGQRAQYHKLSPMLRQLARAEARASRQLAAQTARATQVCAFIRIEADGDELLRQHHCQPLARLGNIYIANIPLGSLAPLSIDTRVTRIEANRGQQAHTDTMAAVLHAELAYQGAGLPQAYTGRGVVMGVMDIGFDLTHPNFYSRDTTAYRIKAFWDMLSADTVGSGLYVGRDYTGRDTLLQLGCSRDGHLLTHGTHTLGIAAGSGYDTRYRGMAPESDLCLVANAVTDDLVFIDSTDVYKYTFATDALGFKYIFDYAEAHHQPCVISFSEGSSQDFWGYDQLYYEFLDSLTGPGRILVASAGNQSTTKTWFRKPTGEPSAGTFLVNEKPEAMFTLKGDGPFTLRFALNYGPRTVLDVPVEQVLQQEDSVLTTSLTAEGQTVQVEIEAYPSCYDATETCYDVQLKTEGYLGYWPRLSVEILGEDADVEFYRVTGRLTTNVQNPDLVAGEPTHNVHSPSSAPCVISVGATSYRDSIVNYLGEVRRYWPGTGGVRVEFSSVGPTMDGRIKPDVVAPGNNIISSYSSFYLEDHPQASDITWDVAHFDFANRTYAWNSNSGTSMSCPAVGGAIALWLQAKPDLTPADVMGILQRTCRHNDPALNYPNNEYGHGEIDVYAGLLDILGLTGIEQLSITPTQARIGVGNGRLLIRLSSPAAQPLTLRLYALNGRLLLHTVLPAGLCEYEQPLGAWPPGVYAVQVDGEPSWRGSSLVRL